MFEHEDVARITFPENCAMLIHYYLWLIRGRVFKQKLFYHKNYCIKNAFTPDNQIDKIVDGPSQENNIRV